MPKDVAIVCLHGAADVRWRGGVPNQALALGRYFKSRCDVYIYNTKPNKFFDDSGVSVVEVRRGHYQVSKALLRIFRKGYKVIHFLGFASKQTLFLIKHLKHITKSKVLFTLFNHDYDNAVFDIADRVIFSFGDGDVINPGVLEEFYKLKNNPQKLTVFTNNSLARDDERNLLFDYIKEHPRYTYIIGSRHDTKDYDKQESYLKEVENFDVNLRGWCDVFKCLEKCEYFLLLLPEKHKRVMPPISLMEAKVVGCKIISNVDVPVRSWKEMGADYERVYDVWCKSE